MTDSSAPLALRLQGVRAGYGETVVLEDIGFDLPERGALALLGRNGVGKTTLLATLMGHTQLHGGRIEYRGQSIERLPVHERSRLGIGYVPQTRDIFPSLSIEENLQVAARKGRWPMERVYELFPRLAERRSHMGNQISGGEQQMLSIGRALMTHPDLIILDEATEGLAPLIVAEIWRVIDEIKASGMAVLIVDRDWHKVLSRSNRALVLQKGLVVLHGESQDLLKDAELPNYLGV
jgi:branched-chain amino acid transport system ATP-binding protein